MDPKIDFATLFFLVMAVVVFLKLRSVLGRRTGEDVQRYERFKAEQKAREIAQQQRNDNIVTLPRKDKEAPAQAPTESRESVAEREAKLEQFAKGNQTLASSIIAINRADPTFEPKHFMQGARAAYEMIVMAFAEGNRNQLKDLLAPDVYEGFVAAIQDREARGERVDQSFVGISQADMQEAELKGSETHVTVRFVSDLISATRSAAGDIISGDPKEIKKVVDVWTFAQETAGTDPNWRLIATQAAA